MRQNTLWLKLLVAGFILCVLSVCTAQSDTNDFTWEYKSKLMRAKIASLHGIKEIYVNVLLPDNMECLSRQDSTTIDHAVEYDLKGAGISVLTAAEWIAMEDSTGCDLPRLIVSADFFEDDNGSLCIYSIDLFLDQVCVVQNDLRMNATTWHTSTFGWASCDVLPVKLGEAVNFCISKFVKDYLFANQEGFLEKRNSVMKEFFGR